MKPVFNLFMALLFCFSYAQDSLTVKQLESLTYTFDVVDGKLTGEGKAFLENEMAKAQYTMIGEYHGSKRISEFTNAIIPVLDNLGCHTFALEVGPVTGEILNNASPDTETYLREINNKYLFKEEDGYVGGPIPFFEAKEDAAFLGVAKEKGWNVFGIDQEFYFSFIMLVDRMYSQLPSDAKQNYMDSYNSIKTTLHQFYIDDENDKKAFSLSVQDSKLISDFLEQMSKTPENISIVEAFEKSIEIYALYAKRKWYENNATRITYMKSQLKEGLTRFNFDISKDKLLIKMGGYHLSKGFSPLSLYEVGNTLNELAAYHGNTALNIGFMSRYSKEGDKITDNYKSENTYFKARKDILQMGKKDKWVVIDLRPMVKGYFYYPQQFKLNPQLQKLVQRYDLLVIPKIEIESTPNYD